MCIRDSPQNGNQDAPPATNNLSQLTEVQIRDMALLTAIMINELKAEDFGFNPNCIRQSRIVKNNAGFLNEELRSNAFKTWTLRNKDTNEWQMESNIKSIWTYTGRNFADGNYFQKNQAASIPIANQSKNANESVL